MSPPVAFICACISSEGVNAREAIHQFIAVNTSVRNLASRCVAGRFGDCTGNGVLDGRSSVPRAPLRLPHSHKMGTPFRAAAPLLQSRGA
jgi:hypothetical protein